MVPINLFTALTTLAFSTLTTSSPTSQLTIRQTSPSFYLQTSVKSGDTSKDGLFAVAWHSYAGGNDVALFENSTETPASLAFLNGTYVEFDLGQSEFPYGLALNNLDGNSYWDEWNAVGINAGLGDEDNNGTTEGFFFNGTCLVSNAPDDFGGWLACDWARGVPQLFWYFSDVDVSPGNIPSTCAVVDLVQVPA